jgi:hypothetical protein
MKKDLSAAVDGIAAVHSREGRESCVGVDEKDERVKFDFFAFHLSDGRVENRRSLELEVFGELLFHFLSAADCKIVDDAGWLGAYTVPVLHVRITYKNWISIASISIFREDIGNELARSERFANSRRSGLIDGKRFIPDWARKKMDKESL